MPEAPSPGSNSKANACARVRATSSYRAPHAPEHLDDTGRDEAITASGDVEHVGTHRDGDVIRKQLERAGLAGALIELLGRLHVQRTHRP